MPVSCAAVANPLRVDPPQTFQFREQPVQDHQLARVGDQLAGMGCEHLAPVGADSVKQGPAQAFHHHRVLAAGQRCRANRVRVPRRHR